MSFSMEDIFCNLIAKCGWLREIELVDEFFLLFVLLPMQSQPILQIEIIKDGAVQF